MKRNKNNDALKAAVNGVYEQYLMSPEAQAFAENHPGQEMTVSLVITMQSSKDKNCTLLYQDPGYVLQSTEAEEHEAVPV